MKAGLVLLVVLSAFPVFAQRHDYGSPTEMRGLHKVYVDAGPDVRLFREMQKQLQKRLPQLQIVSPEDAEFGLVFTYRVVSHDRGRNPYYLGELQAVIDRDRTTHVMSSYQHGEDELDDLASEIVIRFVKEYRRVNP